MEKSSGVLQGPITSGLSLRAVLRMTWSPMRQALNGVLDLYQYGQSQCLLLLRIEYL